MSRPLPPSQPPWHVCRSPLARHRCIESHRLRGSCCTMSPGWQRLNNSDAQGTNELHHNTTMLIHNFGHLLDQSCKWGFRNPFSLLLSPVAWPKEVTKCHGFVSTEVTWANGERQRQIETAGNVMMWFTVCMFAFAMTVHCTCMFIRVCMCMYMHYKQCIVWQTIQHSKPENSGWAKAKTFVVVCSQRWSWS